MLKQPAGQGIAEHVIKKNHRNYGLYYPEKAHAYLPPDDQQVVKYNQEKTQKIKADKIEERKLNPHLLMKAVDRQLNMTPQQKIKLYQLNQAKYGNIISKKPKPTNETHSASSDNDEDLFDMIRETEEDETLKQQEKEALEIKPKAQKKDPF